MIDITICNKILEKYFPIFIYNVEQISGDCLCINNIIMKIIFGLFSQEVKDEIFFIIWDSFFIEGNITLIYALIVIFSDLNKHESILKIMNKLDGVIYDETNSDKLRHEIETVFWNFSNCQKLKYYLFHYQFEFGYTELNFWRNILHKDDKKENEESEKEIKSARKNTYLNKEECDLDWPICLYDREYRFEKIEFAVYKCLVMPKIYEDFYFDKSNNVNMKGKEIMFKIGSESEEEERIKNQIVQYENLVIERRKHICNSKKMTRKIILGDKKKVKDKKQQIEKEIMRSRKATHAFNKVIQESCRLRNHSSRKSEEDLEKNMLLSFKTLPIFNQEESVRKLFEEF